MRRVNSPNRRGAVLALVFLCILPVLAFTALSVDLGLLAIARTQVQNAADTAAMAGARTLNGDSSNNNNVGSVTGMSTAAATNNSVLTTPITGSNLTLNTGRYSYNATNQRFEGQFPGASSENWSMVRADVTVDVSGSMAFSKVLSATTSITPRQVTARATAAHRPRDIAVILDYSGSMRFASMVALPPYTNPRSSNSSDPNYPQFGHYASSSANLRKTSFTVPYVEPNVTVTTSDGRAPLILDFYTDSGSTQAFPQSAPYFNDAINATTPDGDRHLKSNYGASSSDGRTLQDILFDANSSTYAARVTAFNNQGYASVPPNRAHAGYTLGPGYWGKTFFIWPPDPSNRPTALAGDPAGATRDWRKRYYDFPNDTGDTNIVDNSRIWDSSGNLRAPSSSTYRIDYNAILYWIKNIGPNPFPNRLQAGRILYYDAIPDTIDTGSWPPSDMNQRFWKDYIDYCMGVIQTGSSSWYVSVTRSVGDSGFGPDYDWGTRRVTTGKSFPTVGSGGSTVMPAVHTLENPARPRMKYWFGPLSMVDFLGNYNNWFRVNPTSSRFCWWPGTCREAPMYACKLGIRAALQGINQNHPNDLVAMIMFSAPNTSANDPNGRRFNRVRVPLSRDYTRMDESLWYPPSTLGNPSATVRPYDSNNIEVPRAMGGTCYSMPLMLAFNQFSANSNLRTYSSGAAVGDAGGNGRRGAQKIVIFETDGAPNTTASANLVNQGAYNSYYSVRYNAGNPGGSEYPSGVNGTDDNASSVRTEIYGLCTRLAAQDTASPAGYSTPTKPLQIHCIGFGPYFDPSYPGYADNVATLNQMQAIGNVTDGMPAYKLIYGPESEVVARLQQAFTQILQSGVQVSLIE